MWNADALSTSVDSSEQPCALSQEILAMELIPSQKGEMQLGPLSSIPEGADLAICGEGFNDRTAKVRWRGRFYFVFLQDLENQSSRAECASA
jgi:hypothetical protein